MARGILALLLLAPLSAGAQGRLLRHPILHLHVHHRVQALAPSAMRPVRPTTPPAHVDVPESRREVEHRQLGVGGIPVVGPGIVGGQRALHAWQNLGN
jgi:hypothetical protein